MNPADLRLPGPAWALDVDTVEAALATDHPVGLTTAEASARLTPRRRRGLPWLGRGVLSWSWCMTVRYVVLVVSLAGLGWAAGASHIAAAFVLFAFAKAVLWGAVLWVALRAFADVEARARPNVLVLRNGREARVAVGSVAVGDIVRLAQGTLVQVDVRLAEVAGLILAGPLGTRCGMVEVAGSTAGGNMACRGDAVRAGRASGIVVPDADRPDRRVWGQAG